MLSFLASLFSACAISTPFPSQLPLDPATEGEAVVLVLTQVLVKSRDRAEFDRQNAKVLASMRSHPGLLGYSARRELLGSKGWTMTIWATDEARDNFVRSAVHRTAIARGMPTVVDAEFKRLKVLRRDLPKNWTEVLALLDQPEGRRSYWQPQ
jgi:heme-degrading monooxygenase HmoA